MVNPYNSKHSNQYQPVVESHNLQYHNLPCLSYTKHDNFHQTILFFPHYQQKKATHLWYQKLY